MQEFLAIIAYHKKMIFVFKMLFTKKSAILLPPVFLALKILPNTIMAGYLLLFLMFIDMWTGIEVSRLKRNDMIKQGIKPVDKYLFNSTLAKRSIAKFIFYGTGCITAWSLQQIVEFRTISVFFTDLKLTVTLVTVLAFIVIELYSIFFENLPKLGCDIYERFLKIFDIAKNIKTKIKSF